MTWYCRCGKTQRDDPPKGHIYAECCRMAIWRTKGAYGQTTKEDDRDASTAPTA